MTPTEWTVLATVATVIGAAATVAYLLVTIRIFKATARAADATQVAAEATQVAAKAAQESAAISREVLEAVHRPYLGLASLEHKVVASGGGSVDVVGRISNDGTVAAESVEIEWKLFCGTDVRKILQPPCTLNPGAFSEPCHFRIDPGPARSMKDGQLNVEVAIEVRYTGVGTRPFQFYKGLRYDPDTQTFRTAEKVGGRCGATTGADSAGQRLPVPPDDESSGDLQ